MSTDRLTRTVREQIALGRLLPLGGPGDATWITEKAAVQVLRRACAALPGVRLGAVGVALADGATGPDGAGTGDGADVPEAAPAGALPHLPVRIDAGFEAAADEPLPVSAERLRDALWNAARDLLGLPLRAVDLRVTGLLEDGRAAAAGAADTGGAAGPDREPRPDREAPPKGEAGPGAVRVGSGRPGTSSDAVEAAARAVPGVLGLTARLASLGTGLRVRDTGSGPAAGAPGRQVQVQIAVRPGRVPLEVAREVVAAVSAAAAPGAPGPVTVAVLVTDVG